MRTGINPRTGESKKRRTKATGILKIKKRNQNCKEKSRRRREDEREPPEEPQKRDVQKGPEAKRKRVVGGWDRGRNPQRPPDKGAKDIDVGFKRAGNERKEKNAK